MALKYATADCVFFLNGGRVSLQIDQAWDSKDPAVKARPDLFADDPISIHSTVGAPVEQATAAPGEKRTARRASK